MPETIFADTPQSTTSSGRLKRPLTDIVDLESNSTSDTQSQTCIADTDDESSVIDSGNHQQKRMKFNWQTKYELYNKFKDTHNREPKPSEQFEGVKLGSWVVTQRTSYKQGTLDDHRIELLNKEGFVWDAYEVTWQTNYELYKQFKELNHRDPKKDELFKGFNLGNWCISQRQFYKKGTLEESRIDLLNKVRFIWSLDEVSWQTNYELYNKFKETHNREPKQKEQFEGVKLGSWVHLQLIAYKAGKLSQEKIDKLNLLGFVWNPCEVTWQSNYQLYKQFKQQYNREPKTRVQFEGVKLGIWCVNQRTVYKAGKLSPEKIDLLNKAGFVWNRYESEWQTNYELYNQFKETHNREPKQKEQFEGVNLGIWCSRQRQLYKQGKLEETESHPWINPGGSTDKKPFLSSQI